MCTPIVKKGNVKSFIFNLRSNCKLHRPMSEEAVLVKEKSQQNQNLQQVYFKGQMIR